MPTTGGGRAPRAGGRWTWATVAALAAVTALAAGASAASGPPGAGGDPAGSAVAGDRAAESPSVTGVASPLQRVVAVGASVTHGFNAQILVEADGRMQPAVLDLADTLAAVLPGAGDAAAFGSVLFFRAPDQWAARLLAEAVEARPTTLVAIDFLFWFGYGHTGHRPGEPSDLAAREARLARGFALLEPLAEAGVPIVVADLPDMSGAVGRMLSTRQVPAARDRDALNRRIRAWAAARPSVAVVPLAELVGRLQTGERFGAPEGVPLLKPDRLHPTADGLVVVARAIARAMRSIAPELEDEDLELRHEAAVERLRARLAARLEDRTLRRTRPTPDRGDVETDGDAGTDDDGVAGRSDAGPRSGAMPGGRSGPSRENTGAASSAVDAIRGDRGA